MREYYYFPCIDLPVNPKGWFALFFGGDTRPCLKIFNRVHGVSVDEAIIG